MRVMSLRAGSYSTAFIAESLSAPRSASCLSLLAAVRDPPTGTSVLVFSTIAEVGGGDVSRAGGRKGRPLCWLDGWAYRLRGGCCWMRGRHGGYT
jgi:hypothetical protein